MSKYKTLDLTKIKKTSIDTRISKVSTDQFADVSRRNTNIADFIEHLPDILKAADLKYFINAYREAINSGSMIILMIGAHVVKVGLNHILIDAIKSGKIKHLALNGAGVIHDVEIALWGKTSEDVASGLDNGTFGMTAESTLFINRAVSSAQGKYGYGEAVCRQLAKEKSPFLPLSLTLNAYEANIPVTVHSAIGTEIIHQHPEVNGAAIGDTSWTDFKIFCHSVSQLGKKSVVLNIGSAVIMPELFLKALTVARNLGHDAYGFTTATFDMIKHYRPQVNVVERPTSGQGKGYYFIGHHEIMIPLLFAALNY